MNPPAPHELSPAELAAAIEDEAHARVFAMYCKLCEGLGIAEAHLCGFRSGVMHALMYLRSTPQPSVQ